MNERIFSVELYEHAPGGNSNSIKASYADKDCTIPNTHPVVLDYRGWAPVFFDDPNWWMTTDAVCRNERGQLLSRFSPIGARCSFDPRHFGWMS